MHIAETTRQSVNHLKFVDRSNSVRGRSHWVIFECTTNH